MDKDLVSVAVAAQARAFVIISASETRSSGHTGFGEGMHRASCGSRGLGCVSG
jgi:hypothetical protein